MDESSDGSASASSDGETTYACARCGDYYTEAIPATGNHSYGSEATREATCAESGTIT